MAPKTPTRSGSKPKSKPSQHQRLLAKQRAKWQPKNLYLVAFNAVSALAWAYVLFRLVAHLVIDSGSFSLKGLVGWESVRDKLQNRASTAYADFGQVTKWVQTLAFLEIAHVALGLVRSGLGTTVMQVSSRVFMVWFICHNYPAVAAHPAYCSMVFAWSFTEVVRYTHYATGLMDLKLSALEWLRYTTFYPLYPLGAGSEATLIWATLPYINKQYGFIPMVALGAILAIWPPALMMMMGHMHAQRVKHVKTKPIGIKARLEEAAQEAAFSDTPARSTRSQKRTE